jgi:hypothetical protein
VGFVTYHEVTAALQRLLGKVAALALLEGAHALAQVPVAAHDANLQHRRLAALAAPEGSSPDVRVFFNLLARPHFLFGLSLFFKCKEDGSAEFVRREFLVHASHETVAVALVPEVLLDQVDLLVGTAHE